MLRRISGLSGQSLTTKTIECFQVPPYSESKKTESIPLEDIFEDFFPPMSHQQSDPMGEHRGAGTKEISSVQKCYKFVYRLIYFLFFGPIFFGKVFIGTHISCKNKQR